MPVWQWLLDAAGVLLELDLALARRGDFDVVHRQNFRTTRFVYAHCCDHVSPLELIRFVGWKAFRPGS